MSKPYLLLYNSAQFLGWSFILYKILEHYAAGHEHTTLYEKIRLPLTVSQTAALLEIVHPILGLVKSPVVTTAIQVFSRILVLWGAFEAVPESRHSVFVLPTVFAWSLVEIIRYSFYALNLLGSVPGPLKWLRYTAFILLYPLGISGEIGSIVTGLPIVKSTGMYSYPMPNRLNFGFDFYVFLILALLAYIPGSPVMYGHMLKQRKSALSRAKSETKSE
eukprot:GILJ01001089.1.p1 GENE.GILJ01001089.1~~GILJ01001089.1.p1  ORF type:complete len:219 (+),score=14.38 GILJ01001089.1:35-691(+)